MRPPLVRAPRSPVVTAVLEALAGQIRSARLERRMPQAELAERLGVSRHTVIAIEKADSTVAVGTFLEAAALLGVPLMAVEHGTLEAGRAAQQTILRLLPARARRTTPRIDDDF